jgi:hypothetical protein
MAHRHAGFGTLYRRADRREPAHAELTVASQMYRAMEMSFWREKAEAALAEVTAGHGDG